MPTNETPANEKNINSLAELFGLTALELTKLRKRQMVQKSRASAPNGNLTISTISLFMKVDSNGTESLTFKVNNAHAHDWRNDRPVHTKGKPRY